jgi:hypothetical protein
MERYPTTCPGCGEHVDLAFGVNYTIRPEHPLTTENPRAVVWTIKRKRRILHRCGPDSSVPAQVRVAPVEPVTAASRDLGSD